MNAQTYYSNGKLLLSGEYVILDGAKGLALPTRFGQSLHVVESPTKTLTWTSFDEKGESWFKAAYELPTLNLRAFSDIEKAEKLKQILNGAKKLNPTFLGNSQGYSIETKLGFPTDWGLGSSSTLINNIAQWASVDAHKLLWNSFGGSGYDISCAQHDTPILYQLNSGKPMVMPTVFNPPYKEELYFIHLNKKQDSRKAIANYRNKLFDKTTLVAKITSISEKMLLAEGVEALESLIVAHERLLSEVLEMQPIKEKFKDYFGAIKSLGGWGGDFVLATGNEKTPDYFKAKGFTTVIPYQEMILNS